jgi:5-methyltetrahydropteroyltriglutamate--homocysteine methyltransferase
VTAQVEHPEPFARRIVQCANIIGRENVIAAPDCGSGTFVGLTSVGEDVMRMKFDSLVKGAEIASSKLW